MTRTAYNSGDIYGYVMLTGKSYLQGKSIRYVEIICKRCGEIKFTRLGALKNGTVRSCGCLTCKDRSKKHGMSGHPLYHGVWSDMIQRCLNKNNNNYLNYGGRGISICEEWVKSPKSFIIWAENNGWSKGCKLQLDRKNNEEGYSPENCAWETPLIQSRNKRNNFFITAFNETKILPDWGKDKRCKVHFLQIKYRINKMGWDAEKAISTPSTLSKKVLQLSLDGDIINRWDGCREAGRATNINGSSIAKCCNGKAKTAGKFKWQFLN